MGCLFWLKIAPIPIREASTNTSKGLLKSEILELLLSLRLFSTRKTVFGFPPCKGNFGFKSSVLCPPPPVHGFHPASAFSNSGKTIVSDRGEKLQNPRFVLLHMLWKRIFPYWGCGLQKNSQSVQDPTWMVYGSYYEPSERTRILQKWRTWISKTN